MVAVQQRWMVKPNDPAMPFKRAKKVQLGVYRTQIPQNE